MRLFIAIKLNNEIRDSLVGIQNKMKRDGVVGNFTPIENTHITLAFIGEFSDPDAVIDVIESVPFKPFNLTLGGFGSFGDLWWAGIEKNDALLAYVKRLRHALAEADIPFDKKKFSPHITLVRKAVLKRGLPTVDICGKTMRVDKITLFRSDRGKHGMIYTELN